jgi:hypothetical protein
VPKRRNIIITIIGAPVLVAARSTMLRHGGIRRYTRGGGFRGAIVRGRGSDGSWRWQAAADLWGKDGGAAPAHPSQLVRRG